MMGGERSVSAVVCAVSNMDESVALLRGCRRSRTMTAMSRSALKVSRSGCERSRTCKIAEGCAQVGSWAVGTERGKVAH